MCIRDSKNACHGIGNRTLSKAGDERMKYLIFFGLIFLSSCRDKVIEQEEGETVLIKTDSGQKIERIIVDKKTGIICYVARGPVYGISCVTTVFRESLEKR
jgi:hypothetical protein